MTEFKTTQDVLSLNEEYLKAHPDAEPLTSLLSSHGIDEIFELYSEANGREILVDWGDGEDEYKISFK